MYVVLSLIAASCLLQPLESIRDFSAERSVQDDEAIPNTDWFNRAAEPQYEQTIEALVREELKSHGAEAKNISVDMSILEDGSVNINKVRIVVGEQYSQKLDELEAAIMQDLGLDADIAVR